MYRGLLNKPFNPTEEDKKKFKDFKQAIFTVVSCMCDNVGYIKLTSADGFTKISHYNDHCALALSNLQMQNGAKDAIDWSATDGDLMDVISIINSGTSKVQSLKMR